MDAEAAREPQVADAWPADDAAWQARLQAVDPAAYAATRNRIDGAVTRLSPYLSHGCTTLAEVAGQLQARHGLALSHPLLRELGWRAYFQHQWRCLGEGILQDQRPGPRKPAAGYGADDVPHDVRQARCGVPAIDTAVRQLYRHGYLHNHARLWLASYLVHLRGVPWRRGADWMLGLLLDGDLASNHLSWQWVAGTASAKPYLFNADNVQQWAGGAADAPQWLSPGSAIDQPYEQLLQHALGRLPAWVPALVGVPPAQPLAEPQRWSAPPPDLAAAVQRIDGEGDAAPRRRPGLPDLPDLPRVAGRRVWLMHPWALRPPPEAWAQAGPAPLVLAVLPAEVLARWPWRRARWHWVLRRVQALGAPPPLWADAARLQAWLGTGGGAGLAGDAGHAQGRDTQAAPAEVATADHPGLPAAWPSRWRHPAPSWLPEPPGPCRSFSQYWQAVLAAAGHRR